MITEIYNLKGERLSRAVCFDVDHIVDEFAFRSDSIHETLYAKFQEKYEVVALVFRNGLWHLRIKHTDRSLGPKDLWHAKVMAVIQLSRRFYARNR